VCLIKGDH